MSAPRRKLEVLSFSGSHRQMGRAYGEHCRDSIAALYDARVDNAISQAKAYGGRDVDVGRVLAVARACLPITRQYHPEGFEELEGIAEGAGRDVAEILAMNGLTDIRDVLAWGGELEALGGCTAFIAQKDRTTESELVVGQTWDLATDNMPHVIAVHRKPTGAPQTWTLTTAGCLSLIGLNEHGVSIGTTNIRTKNAVPGVTYLSLIHKVLHQRDLPSARRVVDEAPRAGAHFFYVGDGSGRAAALETSPQYVDETVVDAGAFVHTNHCLSPELQAIEAATPAESSHARQARMSGLLDPGPASMRDLWAFLGDTQNGSNAICRYDFNGISSNGAVLMAPQSGRVYACHGPPDAEAIWVDLRTGARVWE